MNAEQFAEALRLTEQEHLGRRRVAERLGLTSGCVIGKLWRHYNPLKANALRVREPKLRRCAERPYKAPAMWTDRILTETWAERKARIASVSA